MVKIHEDVCEVNVMKVGALNGIKVVELATMVSGPYCGKLLADLGADVIKVEPPEGDPARQCGPFPKNKPHLERSALFLYNNTSKRGITLNLDVPAGLGTLKDLIKWADILIDNHPPQRLESLGLTWDVMRKMNPGLVYTSITPYGRTGPRADVKGDELTIIHAGGLGNLMPVRVFDVDRAPVKMGGYAVGYHGGLTAAVATLGVILGRLKTGRGQLIDISLQEVILALMRVNITSNRYHRTRWNRVPDRPPAMGRLKASDGYIVVGAVEDHHWRALRDLMGTPEWAAGKEWESMYYRIYHLMEIAPLIDEWALKQKKEDIHHKGAKKGIPMGPLNSAKEVMENEQYAARGYFVTVEHPEAGKHKYAGWPYQMTASPPCVYRPAPLLGQHNQEVFCDILGYSSIKLRRLQQSGAIPPKSRKGGK
jgi:crotonobetainyl-CoA:carnitine CoA-transferase CaiB-like acyl-CoA transferase